MAAYLVVDIAVHDPAAYEAYKQGVPPLIEKYGGRYLVRGGAVEVLEGAWQPARLVVVEFPDTAAAKAFLEAPEYAALRAARQASTHSNLLVVQGV
jgi:uncharacterized protein (DUF1330 family)